MFTLDEEKRKLTGKEVFSIHTDQRDAQQTVFYITIKNQFFKKRMNFINTESIQSK